MKLTPLDLKNAYLIHYQRLTDDRGYFERTFCVQTLETAGIDFHTRQCSIAANKNTGTLRGMHFQNAPFSEAKIVSCLQGAVFDVLVDCRKNSKDFGKWQGITLQSNADQGVYIPAGFAHGYITLEDNSILHYQMNEDYQQDAATRFNWASKSLSIQWPIEPICISDADANAPAFHTLFGAE